MNCILTIVVTTSLVTAARFPAARVSRHLDKPCSDRGCPNEDWVCCPGHWHCALTIEDCREFEAKTTSYPETTKYPYPETTTYPYPETTTYPDPETTTYPNEDTTTYPYPETTTYPHEDTTTYPYDDTTTYPDEDTTTYPDKSK